MLHALMMVAAVTGWCQQVPAPKAVFSPEEIAAAQKDPKAFSIGDESAEIEWRGFALKPRQSPPPVAPDPDESLVMIDRIINIGRKIWTIIEENKPVVDVKTQYANAMPEGITHWAQLTGWDTPVSTVYGFYAKNAYGVRIIDVKYSVLRVPGGAYKGQGRYLTGVTVEPLLISVGWGYRFTLTAEAGSVTNADKTGQNPLAAMTMILKWRIQTPIKDQQGTSVYYVRGDGFFKEIGGPFSNQRVKKTSARVQGLTEQFLPKLLRGAAW